MILVVDNFDSFTWNLVHYLEKAGEKVCLVRNDIHPDNYNFPGIKGILLSPGPGTPSTSGYIFEVIQKFEMKLPILGICLGHQALGEYYGATIDKAPAPMHGKLSSIDCDTQDPIFKNLPQNFNVVRYHSLIIKDLPTALKATAWTDHLIMALSHEKLPIYGIQFHPEAFLTENGQEIIENWVKVCRDLTVE